MQKKGGIGHPYGIALVFLRFVDTHGHGHDVSNLQLGMVRYNTIGKHLVKVITKLFQFLRRPVTRKSTFFTFPVMALFKFNISPSLPSNSYSPVMVHTLVLTFSLRPEASPCGSEAPCGVRFDLGVTARVPSATTRVQSEMRSERGKITGKGTYTRCKKR